MEVTEKSTSVDEPSLSLSLSLRINSATAYTNKTRTGRSPRTTQQWAGTGSDVVLGLGRKPFVWPSWIILSLVFL